MNYKEIVDDLQKKIDQDTKDVVAGINCWSGPVIFLFGDLEAPFLRAIRRKSEKLGIEVYTDLMGYGPAVYDRETYKGTVDERREIDESKPMTADSEGVLEIIKAIGMKRKDICIVGRGPAVKGLAKALLDLDHTVTVCHSKTSHNVLVKHLYNAEVVILGTPELPEGITLSGAELVMDIGGAVYSPIADACENYLGLRQIGRICTSILCNRAARWYL